MRYTKFEIKNYRGIKDLQMDLAKSLEFKIFTLVGLNESGKTTILEAIDFLQEDIPEDKRHKLIPKNKKRNFSDEISVKATVKLDDQDKKDLERFLLETLNLESIKLPNDISFKKAYFYSKSEYKSENTVWDFSCLVRKKRKGSTPFEALASSSGEGYYEKIVKYIKTELLPPIIYYPNFLSDFPERIYLTERHPDIPQQKFYRRVLQDVLDSLDEDDDRLTIEEIATRILADDQESKRQSLDSTLQAMGQKITVDLFSKRWEKLLNSKKQRASGRQVTFSYGKKKDREGKVFPYVEIKIKEGVDTYFIHERSLGFRWFFSFLLFTQIRKKRAIDRGEMLFLIDEPASNLHSNAQSKLLETFGELVDRSTLIYTTHSHHLISPDWLEGAFIVRNKALDYDEDFDYDAAQTDIEATPYRHFVTTHPDQQTYYQPIFDSLDYSPSKLEMVPDIIIVEGKNDFYSLKYINEIILNKRFDLNFYPGNGAGKNDRIIRLYISWSRNFNVLMDADTAGKLAQKKYQDELGVVVTDRIFTLEDVNKSWQGFSTEELFSEIEKDRIQKEFFPESKSYSKKKFNQAIQNLLFLKRSVKITQLTIKKFESLFDFMVQKL